MRNVIENRGICGIYREVAVEWRGRLSRRVWPDRLAAPWYCSGVVLEANIPPTGRQYSSRHEVSKSAVIGSKQASHKGYHMIEMTWQMMPVSYIMILLCIYACRPGREAYRLQRPSHSL